jgi:2-desacetyl-2-hydroxyethyl bacteriochlorophyllide A dehydrogenase
MSSRYVVFPRPGVVELGLEDVPEPGPGELRCEAITSLISIGTEGACLRGVFDPGTNWADWVRYPFRPGYSMAARVVGVGEGVAGFRDGDLVASWTAHSQRFLLPAEAAHRVPPGVSADEAAWTVLGSTTQLAVRRAGLELGERVGVIGAGLLGQLVVQYCAVAGARSVLVVDPAARRLEVALAHGATDALALDVAAARDAIAERTGGRLLDVVFDVTGHPAVLGAAVGLVRQLGRVVLLGDTPTPTQQRLGPGVVSNSVAILGIHALARPARADDFHPWSTGTIAELFLEYVSQRRLRVAELITHRHSPLAAAQVYAELERDRSSVIGAVFDWSRAGLD